MAEQSKINFESFNDTFIEERLTSESKNFFFQENKALFETTNKQLPKIIFQGDFDFETQNSIKNILYRVINFSAKLDLLPQKRIPSIFIITPRYWHFLTKREFHFLHIMNI